MRGSLSVARGGWNRTPRFDKRTCTPLDGEMKPIMSGGPLPVASMRNDRGLGFWPFIGLDGRGAVHRSCRSRAGANDLFGAY